MVQKTKQNEAKAMITGIYNDSIKQYSEQAKAEAKELNAFLKMAQDRFLNGGASATEILDIMAVYDGYFTDEDVDLRKYIEEGREKGTSDSALLDKVKGLVVETDAENYVKWMEGDGILKSGLSYDDYNLEWAWFIDGAVDDDLNKIPKFVEGEGFGPEKGWEKNEEHANGLAEDYIEYKGLSHIDPRYVKFTGKTYVYDIKAFDKEFRSACTEGKEAFVNGLSAYLTGLDFDFSTMQVSSMLDPNYDYNKKFSDLLKNNIQADVPKLAEFMDPDMSEKKMVIRYMDKIYGLQFTWG